MKITTATIDKVFNCKIASIETMEFKGYELIKELFCNSSGLGAPDEIALTKGQLLTELGNLLKEHQTLTAKITKAGQFQVYIGLFKKVKKATIKRLSATVFKRNIEGGYIIRLYDTDILIKTGNKYTLNSGGWQTATTKKWLNEFLPNGVYVFQKDFNWHVTNNGKCTIKDSTPFSNGMTLMLDN